MLSVFSSLSITGIVVAVVLNMIIGSVWYSSHGFMTRWMKFNDLSAKKMSTNAVPAMLTAILNSIVLAVTLAALQTLIGIASASELTVFILWMWIAFSFVPQLMRLRFECRPMGLLPINAGSDLAMIASSASAFYFLAS